MQAQNVFYAPSSFLADNKNLFIGASETIVLEHISTAGFSNLSFTLTNFSSSTNSVSVVKIYGSNDGTNYYSINSSALSTITAGSTANVTFTAVVNFVRVTATSGGTSNIDCYLVGIP